MTTESVNTAPGFENHQYDCYDLTSCSDSVLERLERFGEVSEQIVPSRILDNTPLDLTIDAASEIAENTPDDPVLGILGRSFESMTNFISVTQALNRDRDAGDKSYSQTMAEISGSVLQISAMTIGGALAAIAGSPAVAVIGAGLLASYGARKLKNYILGG